MKAVGLYSKEFKNYETLFHLIVIDVANRYGIFIDERTQIDYTSDLLGSITMITHRDERYKIELGKVKEEENVIRVEFEVLYETPIGFQPLDS